MRNYCVLIAFILFGCSISQKSADTSGNGLFVPFTDAHIQYEGRIGMKADAAELYWPGTALRINFSGTAVKALLKDEKGQNYYSVIVDGENIHKIDLDTTKRLYTLAENLAPGNHTIELFKITQYHKEYNRGFTKFYGFDLDSGKILSPPKQKKNKFEFYGNSVTCGHAIEDTTGGDSGASKFENNYLTYAAITARHYNAQYSCIAKSGIGVMVSWAPAIMPEIYNLTNPADSTSTWDFSKYTPDVVVVNLFQNDSGIINRTEFKEFKRRFGTKSPSEEFIVESYQKFIQNIRKAYPRAKIICTLGSMGATQEGSKWPSYIESAVENLNDNKVYTHFFAYKNTPGHPRVNEHKIMAESLIKFIETHDLMK